MTGNNTFVPPSYGHEKSVIHAYWTALLPWAVNTEWTLYLLDSQSKGYSHPHDTTSEDTEAQKLEARVIQLLRDRADIESQVSQTLKSLFFSSHPDALMRSFNTIAWFEDVWDFEL